WDGWLLLGIAVVSALPIVLVVLGSIAVPGGSLEAFGVKIRWAETLTTVGITIPPRLGVTVGLPMRDSGTREILATLREASRHAVAVVDLEDGQAWWETRLLVLSAGSVRRGHPSVVVFVATEEGVERRFQGWALATDVERGLLAARDDLRLAYERAAV